MSEYDPVDSDLLIEVVNRSPMIEALREEPMDRRELEQRLEISKSTVHRNTRSLSERGLIVRTGGEYRLTAFGEAVAEIVTGFREDLQSTGRIAPLFDAVSDIQPPCPIADFADATVSTADNGDPFAPLARFVTLVQETDSLRMFDSYAIAPTYMDEIHGRVLDGLETKVIERPNVAEDVMKNYPEKCVELCASEFLTMRIHEDLPLGLAIFASRVGIGLRDPDTGAPRVFIDTDAPEARAWAMSLFESYWDDAIPLPRFNPKSLRDALGSTT
ncbi:MAG: helix-turn-helix transcriptional regulator [Natronomonas sp.]